MENLGAELRQGGAGEQKGASQQGWAKKTHINVFFLLLDFQIYLFLFSRAVVPTDHLNGSPL